MFLYIVQAYSSYGSTFNYSQENKFMMIAFYLILVHAISFYLNLFHLIDSPVTSPNVLSVNFYFNIKKWVTCREEEEPQE